MASNLLAMASNLRAMTSILVAMASNLTKIKEALEHRLWAMEEARQGLCCSDRMDGRRCQAVPSLPSQQQPCESSDVTLKKKDF